MYYDISKYFMDECLLLFFSPSRANPFILVGNNFYKETKMTKSQRKLAEEIGVSQYPIEKAKKSLGIETETISEADAERIKDVVSETAELQRQTKLRTDYTSNEYDPDVRRIDQSDDSSVLDMLQDCKEQYVANEKLIKRLTYEIEQQTLLMHGNGNGTLSAVPQLGMMEKFQKINITLRNQIVSLEQELGRVAEPKKDDDPFH